MYQLHADHNAVVPRARFSPKWTFDAGAKINGGLAIADDTMYLDTLAGDVVALDLATGKQRWKTHFDNMVMTTPVLADGRVVVGTGRNAQAEGSGAFAYANDSPNALALWGRPEGDHVVALDAATGAKVWSYRTIGEDMPSPAAIAGKIVFANGDQHAYALDAATGQAVWRTDLNGVSTMASALIANADTVVVSVCRDFAGKSETDALNVTTGRIVWRSLGGNCDSSPTSDGKRIYLGGVQGATTSYGYGGRSTINVVDARTGRRLWTFADGGAGPYTAVGSSERAIAGVWDGAYYQSFPTSNAMVALDAAGHLLWRTKTMAPVKMSAVSTGGRLYFGDTAGLFYIVDTRDGHLVQTKIFDQPFATAPPIVDGQSLFVADGSTVHAIPLEVRGR
ncbi:MAG TPA: PQQ-binding-like beta-propeller repeat protein [Candidatus Acidoferrales bacterium]|nr:PQQ-binding-like beta-propeller repeat protein [Candidatus Acidoferrales bacterium]